MPTLLGAIGTKAVAGPSLHVTKDRSSLHATAVGEQDASYKVRSNYSNQGVHALDTAKPGTIVAKTGTVGRCVPKRNFAEGPKSAM